MSVILAHLPRVDADRLNAAGITALGSMTVAGPADRMTEAALTRFAPMLSRAGQELAPRLANLLGPNPGTTVAALDLCGDSGRRSSRRSGSRPPNSLANIWNPPIFGTLQEIASFGRIGGSFTITVDYL